MSWEDQGRQEHGWFGHGTAPPRDKQAEGGGGVAASAGITRRLEAVASGTIAALPAGLRRRAEAQFIGSNLARLTSALAAWNAGNRVRQLITLDPVSRVRPDYAKVAASAAEWIDFNAVGGGLSN